MKKSTKTLLSTVLAFAIAVSPITVNKANNVEAATGTYVNYATSAVVTTSSNESAEYTGDKAIDQNMSTRWSSAFADNQWIMFDLGTIKTVGTVVINWEAAYASEYTISWSQDNVTWYDAVIYSNSQAGEKTHLFNKPARFVKITGNRRGTPYGISIFEVQLIGYEEVVETTTAAPETTVAPETTTSNSPEKYWTSITASHNLLFENCDNNMNPVKIVNWQKPIFAEEYGVYMTAPAPITSVSVNGVTENICAIQGAGVVVYDSAFTKFYNTVIVNYEGGPSQIIIKNVFKNEFETTTEETTTVAPTTQAPETTTAAPESETVAPGTNLASLSTARVYASSEEHSSLGAQYAIDGDMSTRWSSAWRNGESITVDLGKIYLVGNVTIFWEAAYASEYTISWSQDGVTWYDAVHMGCHSAGECTNWFLKPARFVKVTADKRATQYGASIYELKLIGEEYTGQIYTRG
ncbi:MAG: discoidin domain-containing protein [Lachnospiraceae bacterium]|nr:discoidin domain-containing protein [Lachnospiraceae bacterium]